MQSNFNDLKNENMNATEFIKENYTLTNGGEDYRCNHSGQLVGAEDISEAYHEHKLKILGIADVSQQRELLLLFKKWEQEVYYKPYDGAAELTVDTYLKSNCG